jgi:hypothetical protein
MVFVRDVKCGDSALPCGDSAFQPVTVHCLVSHSIMPKGAGSGRRRYPRSCWSHRSFVLRSQCAWQRMRQE